MAAQFLLWFLIGLCGAIVVLGLITVPLWSVIALAVFGLGAAIYFRFWRLTIIACLCGFVSGVIRVMFPEPLIINSQVIAVLDNLLEQVSVRVNSVFQSIFPDPVSGFSQGIITGGQGVRFSRDFYEALQKTSTMHLIAVSGYNVSIIGRYIQGILVGFTMNRRWVWLASLMGIWLFIMFVGAPQSAVRAGIMVSMFIIAERLGRVGQSWRVLVYAGALMMFFDPRVIFDIGFQLSFMATAGIVISSSTGNGSGGLRAMLRDTLWAQVMVLPLIAYRFGTVTVLGLAANLVIIPLMPLLMVTSIIPALAGLVYLTLGRVLATAVLPALWATTRIIELTARLPLASIHIPKFGAVLFAVYYGVVIFYLYRRQKNYPTYA